MTFCASPVSIGAFSLCYGTPPDACEPFVLTLRCPRREASASVPFWAGNPGGHVKIAKAEQPLQAAWREMREELVKPNGTPLLADLSLDRLTPLGTGLSYGCGTTEPNVTVWFAYTCALNIQESLLLNNYVERLATDKRFAQSVLKASHGETAGALFLPVTTLLSEMEREKIVYVHDHGTEIVLPFLETLARQAPLSPTLGLG